MVAARRVHHPALDLGEPHVARCRALHRHRPRDLRAARAAARRIRVIGEPVLRVEDQRFLTGCGRFIDDLSFPGMLHCALVRSAHPHARIRKISLPLGAVAFSGRDLDIGPMRAGWRLPGMVEPPRWALARDTVRHVGEPLAAVFAHTPQLAQDAAEAVEVDYEPLPLIEDETCFRLSRGDAAAVDAAFAAAAYRIDLDLVNNRLCGAAIEARGAIATPDTLYCSTQTPHHIRGHVCTE